VSCVSFQLYRSSPTVLYSFCYTGGDDCIVRLWKTDEGEDQEPPTAIEAGESIMTLAASVRSPFSALVRPADPTSRTMRGFPEAKIRMCDSIKQGTQIWRQW
jgi:hypothetical protein